MANKSNKTFLAFLIGTIAGAAVGLLLAPKKGEETREDVSAWLKEKREASREALTELREKSGEALSELKEKGNDVVTDIKDRFPQQKEKVVSAIKAGRDALRRSGVKKETQKAEA